jgi:hypothetical protein
MPGYTFKHALVQDAAYGTLLRSRRQQLHAHITATLEDWFPEIVAAQPALLAHRCTEAGLSEKAIAYWLTAGRQAWGRSATAEAVALLHRGLALPPALPEGDGRWGRARPANRSRPGAHHEQKLGRAGTGQGLLPGTRARVDDQPAARAIVRPFRPILWIIGLEPISSGREGSPRSCTSWVTPPVTC